MRRVTHSLLLPFCNGVLQESLVTLNLLSLSSRQKYCGNQQLIVMFWLLHIPRLGQLHLLMNGWMSIYNWGGRHCIYKNQSLSTSMHQRWQQKRRCGRKEIWLHLRLIRQENIPCSHWFMLLLNTEIENQNTEESNASPVGSWLQISVWRSRAKKIIDGRRIKQQHCFISCDNGKWLLNNLYFQCKKREEALLLLTI